jgi:hypothetical protein
MFQVREIGVVEVDQAIILAAVAALVAQVGMQIAEPMVVEEELTESWGYHITGRVAEQALVIRFAVAAAASAVVEQAHIDKTTEGDILE